MSSWINTAPLAAVTRLRSQIRNFLHARGKKKSQRSGFVLNAIVQKKTSAPSPKTCRLRKISSDKECNTIAWHSIPTVHWIGWQSTEMHLQWDYIRLPIPPTFRRDHASYGPSLPTTSFKGVEWFISVSPKDVSDVILLEDVTTHSLLDWTKHLRFSLTIILFQITVTSMPL
jgi:hypothetical protein